MKNKGKMGLFVAALGLSVVLFISGCGSSKTASQVGDKYIPVEVQPSAAQTLVETTSFSGKVSSEHDVSLAPKTAAPSRVTAVNVQVGDTVQAGAVLFTLDSTDLQKAVDNAEMGVRTAEANYQKTKEGIDLAKTNLERQKQLYEAGAVSKSQLEQAENQASETPLELAQIQWDQAGLTLKQAQDSLSNTVVTAPADGTVSAVNVKVGEMATASQTAVTLTQLNSLYVGVNVPENIVNEVTVGQDAKIMISSAGTDEITGKITNVAPAADSQTKLFAVKVSVDNTKGQIKPGMFAKVDIPTQTRPNVLAVNSDAVVSKNGKTVVYVIEDNAAVEKEVTTGLDTGTLVEITQGLNPGEQVVVKGQTLVQQGSKVKIVGGSAS